MPSQDHRHGQHTACVTRRARNTTSSIPPGRDSTFFATIAAAERRFDTKRAEATTTGGEAAQLFRSRPRPSHSAVTSTRCGCGELSTCCTSRVGMLTVVLSYPQRRSFRFSPSVLACIRGHPLMWQELHLARFLGHVVLLRDCMFVFLFDHKSCLPEVPPCSTLTLLNADKSRPKARNPGYTKDSTPQTASTSADTLGSLAATSHASHCRQVVTRSVKPRPDQMLQTAGGFWPVLNTLTLLQPHQTLFTTGDMARARVRPSQNLHSADQGHAGGAPTRPCAHPTAKSFSRVQLAPEGLDVSFEYCTYTELIPQPGRAHRNGDAWSSRGDMAFFKSPLWGRSCAQPVRSQATSKRPCHHRCATSHFSHLRNRPS